MHLRMTTGAVSAVVRYPGLQWQPYADIGPAVFWARANGTGLSCDHRCQGPEVNQISVTAGWVAKLACGISSGHRWASSGNGNS